MPGGPRAGRSRRPDRRGSAAVTRRTRPAPPRYREPAPPSPPPVAPEQLEGKSAEVLTRRRCNHVATPGGGVNRREMQVCQPRFAECETKAIIHHADDLRHKFWRAMNVIASVPAHGSSCHVDISCQSGFRDTLYFRWGFSGGYRLFRVGILDRECGSRSAGLRESLRHR